MTNTKTDVRRVLDTVKAEGRTALTAPEGKLVCEAYGIRCEIHMAGWGNLQVLGATSEDTSEYYEKGLMAPGVDIDAPDPYLAARCDVIDGDGYVHLPTLPGMGYDIQWDYIDDNVIDPMAEVRRYW